MLHTRGYGACAIVAPLSIYRGDDRPATGLLRADIRRYRGMHGHASPLPPSLCLCTAVMPGAARESERGTRVCVREKFA